MATYPLTGIPSSFKAPIATIEANFNQGPSVGTGAVRRTILAMPMTSAGTWTANTVYKVENEGQARDGGGIGGPAHRAARIYLKANAGDLYVVPYAASSGGSPVAATGTITVTASPTGQGRMRVTVCGESFTIAWTTSSTATTIATAIAAFVNARPWLPVTAGSSTDTVTLTARIAGESQGDGTVGVIRFHAEILTLGKGVSVATSGAALGLGTGTAGADGTTSEVANLTAALAAIANTRHYYITISAWSSTAIAALKTHVSTKNEPKQGIKCKGIAGYTGAQTALSTVAIAQNSELIDVINQPNSEHDVAELAGNFAAIRQKREKTESHYVFNGYNLADWHILPVKASADYPDIDDVNDAVTDGITLVQSNEFGSWIAMSCTTRSKDSTGSNDDFRSTESHRVSVVHDFHDTWVQRHNADYSARRFKDDEKLADGSINFNAKKSEKTVRPSDYKLLHIVADEFAANDRIQNVQSTLDSLIVVKDPNNPGRMECKIDLRSIDNLNQTTVELNETSPG